MAKIETVGYDPKNRDIGAFAQIINVTNSVGVRGINHREDVMVVQALLKYALDWRDEFKGEDFPVPCGAFIPQTVGLIKKYQKWNNEKTGSRVSTDGRIDPLIGGVYVFGRRKQWTIYTLNVHAMETTFRDSGRKSFNYIEKMCQQWGYLRSVLGKTTVGSLDLELEDGSEVGSLGLALE